MNTEPIEFHLTRTCKFEISYGALNLEYVEHSTDHFHSDHVTNIEIDEAEARKIIEIMVQVYGKKILRPVK